MLEKEKAFYEKNKEEFIRSYLGKWLVIHGDRLLGHFDSFDAAYSEGVKILGNVPMLVQQVSEDAGELTGQNAAYYLGLMNARLI